MARRRDIIGVLDATGSKFEVGYVTVTDIPVRIPDHNLRNRKAITLFNNDFNNIVKIGNSNVTFALGYPLLPKQGLPFDLGDGAQIYGICDTGKTADVNYLEVDNG